MEFKLTAVDVDLLQKFSSYIIEAQEKVNKAASAEEIAKEIESGKFSCLERYHKVLEIRSRAEFALEELWRAIGERLGFDPSTRLPSSKGPEWIEAEPAMSMKDRRRAEFAKFSFTYQENKDGFAFFEPGLSLSEKDNEGQGRR